MTTISQISPYADWKSNLKRTRESGLEILLEDLGHKKIGNKNIDNTRLVIGRAPDMTDSGHGTGALVIRVPL